MIFFLPQSTYFTARGQSYFSRLPKYWPPIPLFSRRVCPPPQQRRGGEGDGGSIFWKTRERIALLQRRFLNNAADTVSYRCCKVKTGQEILNQCWGSVTCWYGSLTSGSSDTYLWLTEVDADLWLPEINRSGCRSGTMEKNHKVRRNRGFHSCFLPSAGSLLVTNRCGSGCGSGSPKDKNPDAVPDPDPNNVLNLTYKKIC